MWRYHRIKYKIFLNVWGKVCELERFLVPRYSVCLSFPLPLPFSIPPSDYQNYIFTFLYLSNKSWDSIGLKHLLQCNQMFTVTIPFVPTLPISPPSMYILRRYLALPFILGCPAMYPRAGSDLILYLYHLFVSCTHAKLFPLCRLFVTLWTVAHQAPLSMGIFQARILGWGAMPSSRESFRFRDQTCISYVSCIGK